MEGCSNYFTPTPYAVIMRQDKKMPFLTQKTGKMALMARFTNKHNENGNGYVSIHAFSVICVHMNVNDKLYNYLVSTNKIYTRNSRI